MIFINTRPLDEGVHYDRRPSKAPSHHSVHSIHAEPPKRVHMSRVAFCLLVFYLLVSAVPVLLHYPLSLVSLTVPCLVVLYALCHINSENRSDYWPCCLVAIVGILIKTAAIIIYIAIFPFKDDMKKVALIPVRLQCKLFQTEKLKAYRLLFFIVLTALEIFILLVGICLKWHLVAFEKSNETSTHKRVSFISYQKLVNSTKRKKRGEGFMPGRITVLATPALCRRNSMVD
ncbi:unnamed protein product [Haemonchus placei]|uniref:Membrane protein BILF1 n=1 Tax=Haemonchus placei TaxID=6290 RepID=A0A0N4WPL2_HAEPC|nr:unnamed protein product [Haemonchus placei]